jgi:hypothetical protein
MVIKLGLICYDMLANFLFSYNFAPKKQTFSRYKALITKILELEPIIILIWLNS